MKTLLQVFVYRTMSWVSSCSIFLVRQRASSVLNGACDRPLTFPQAWGGSSVHRYALQVLILTLSIQHLHVVPWLYLELIQLALNGHHTLAR